jgi:hypothetical protein
MTVMCASDLHHRATRVTASRTAFGVFARRIAATHSAARSRRPCIVSIVKSPGSSDGVSSVQRNGAEMVAVGRARAEYAQAGGRGDELREVEEWLRARRG